MQRIFKQKIAVADLDALFQSDEKCMEFIANLKWEDGFVCRKCENTNWCAGKTPHSRRCTKCKSEESAAAGTIFHNCKFPISKAFYIAYHVCKSHEEISTYEFARRLSLRQMTCWNFKAKIRSALSSMEGLTETEKTAIERILEI